MAHVSSKIVAKRSDFQSYPRFAAILWRELSKGVVTQAEATHRLSEHWRASRRAFAIWDIDSSGAVSYAELKVAQPALAPFWQLLKPARAKDLTFAALLASPVAISFDESARSKSSAAPPWLRWISACIDDELACGPGAPLGQAGEHWELLMDNPDPVGGEVPLPIDPSERLNSKDDEDPDDGDPAIGGGSPHRVDGVLVVAQSGGGGYPGGGGYSGGGGIVVPMPDPCESLMSGYAETLGAVGQDAAMANMKSTSTQCTTGFATCLDSCRSYLTLGLSNYSDLVGFATAAAGVAAQGRLDRWVVGSAAELAAIRLCVSAAGYATAGTVAWFAGTWAGCNLACARDTCAYDFAK